MRDATFQSLAVGFFDGVHLGHQAILRGADAVLTFSNHPLTVLAPEKAPRLIMSCEERVAAIKACGVKDVMALDFTRELAEMTAEEFAASFLKRPGDLFPVLRCGANWRFGRGGEGDAEFLRGMGIEVSVMPYAEYKGERVSSSRIRRCLENGEIEDANAMMGRRFKVQGSRFKGKGLGGRLGYPTVNFRIGEQKSSSTNQTNLTNRVELPLGVYVVELEGVCGIANYGYAPTMGPEAWKQPVLEVHIPSSKDSFVPIRSDSLTTCCISILRFVRPEKKFNSIEDLKRQIAADCATIAP